MDYPLMEGYWKMRTLRNTSVTASALVLLALGVVGCAGAAQMTGSFEAGTPPPPPPAAPADDDGDGIPNADDKCPAEKEDGKAPDDKDGCPNLDEDNDKIPVPQDKCPTEPETVNEFEDDDGCPDKKPLVMLVGQEVRINQKIQFKKGSAGIEDESKPVLDAVAEVLKKNADIQLVEVGGHASKEGDAGFNKNLTQKRVESVSKELVTRGVEKERLFSQGYGFYCLTDTGETPESMEKNRRVEFKVLFRGGKATDMKRGCEGSEAAKIKPKALPAKPWEAKKAADAKPVDAKPADKKLAQPKK